MFLSCHVICGLAFCLFFYVNMCASVTQTGHQMAMFVAQSADALTPYAHQQHVCPGSSLFVGRPVGRSVQESYITSLSPFLVRSYELWRIINSWKHILVLGVCGLIKWNLIYIWENLWAVQTIWNEGRTLTEKTKVGPRSKLADLIKFWTLKHVFY